MTLQPPGLITHPFSAPISGHFPSSFPHNENGPQGPVADTTYFFLTPTPPLAFGPGLLTSTVSSGSTSLTCHTACWVTSSGCSVHLGLNMPKLKWQSSQSQLAHCFPCALFMVSGPFTVAWVKTWPFPWLTFSPLLRTTSNQITTSNSHTGCSQAEKQIETSPCLWY